MNEAQLTELVRKIQRRQAESQTIEVKRSKKEASKSLYDTLSSFSNQDDGGTIVFGLYEADGFDIAGVDDVQRLMNDVKNQCEQMLPKVRAVFTTAEIDGKNVVAAQIPPIDAVDRPCFYAPKGRMRGSYIRVGEADMPMTEYEVYSYEAYRKKYRDDIRITERADMTSLDDTRLDMYILGLKADKPNLARLEDSKIKKLMSIESDGKPTLAAQMLFGLYPQAYYPQLCITATAVPGTEIGETDADGARFIDNRRIEGTIEQMLEGAIAFVMKNTRTRTIIDKATGKRTDRSDYPVNSVREAVLNALVHRDYSIHTEGMPIVLNVFSDRLEIRNPGGLYGRLTLDMLGKIQPDTRNPVLATALEAMHITENRYSGIPTMRRELREYGLPEPRFEDNRGEFCVCFYKTAQAAGEYDDRTEGIVQFCKTPRTRKELAEFLGLSSVTYAIKRYITPLAEKGIIFMTYPNTPSAKNQKYYS